MKNVYLFIKDPKSLEEVCKHSMIYNIMEKLNNGGKLTTGIDDGFDRWKHKDENGNYTTKPNYQKK